MTPSLRIDIAEAILWLHVVVIAFSVFGLVAIPLGAWGGWRGVRVFWWRAVHIGILGIVALQALLGRACFLTIWESDLLRLAGEVAPNEPLIQQWVSRAIYWPLPLWVFAVLYVTVCVYALLLWWLIPPRFPRRPASSSAYTKAVCLTHEGVDHPTISEAAFPVQPPGGKDGRLSHRPLRQC
jgi:hypothetical protein